jgi:hypothetical protein
MNLVSESLNELYKFEKKNNPLISLGVGQINEITKWLDEMEIEDYNINDDYSINIIENGLDLDDKYLLKIPDFIKFKKVDGYFSCPYNKLSNLNNCPTEVGGIYQVNHNRLTTLKGCPGIIHSNFYCSYNKLTSLEGCPAIVEGDFYCKGNTVKFIEEDVRKVCNVKGEIYV